MSDDKEQVFKTINKLEFYKLLTKYRLIQKEFKEKFDVNDIFSNSKIYEILIANSLSHNLIPGHSGSKDAIDDNGNEYEYKHYKKSSSNHTWTFNDFSDTTIEKLNLCSYVVFAHIDNSVMPPNFDWCYLVPGKIVSEFLKKATLRILNTRKMINISKNNIENSMGVNKTFISSKSNGRYSKWINNIYEICSDMEKCTGVDQLLTSNKIWEVVVAAELNHNVNSEQGGRAGAHDAFDKSGNVYEYKVSKNYSWNFQDISDNVLNKYLDDKSIILAVVDKENTVVKAIYEVNPKLTVKRLKEKLKEKSERFALQNKIIRRLQVSLSKGDLKLLNANKLY
tara:strand:- start:2752 stop:3765 length:1014 start_codon:yes stop_codon:yes gene_type:complete